MTVFNLLPWPIGGTLSILQILSLEQPVTPATQASTQAALEAAGVTFHGIRSGGGPGALDLFSDATGGTKNPLAGDGSNIASVLDDINDIILDAAESKRPTAMMLGPDAIDSTNVDVPVNLSLNALKVTFTSPDIETREAANTAIGLVKEAIDYLGSRRTMLGASFNRLQSALETNLNRRLGFNPMPPTSKMQTSHALADSVNVQLQTQTSLKCCSCFYQIKSSTLGKLLG